MVSDRLLQARALASKLGCRELDRLAGLAEGHVSMIETGRRPNLEMSTATALVRVLGVSLDWLVSGVGPTPSARSVRMSVEAARSRYAPKTKGAA